MRRLFVLFALLTVTTVPTFAQKIVLTLDPTHYGATDVLAIDDDGVASTRAWVLIKTDNTLQLVTARRGGGFCFEEPVPSPIAAAPTVTFVTERDGPIEVVKIRNPEPSIVVTEDGTWIVQPATVAFVAVERKRCQ